MRLRDFVAGATIWEDGHRVLDKIIGWHDESSIAVTIGVCAIMVIVIYGGAALLDMIPKRLDVKA